MEGLDEEQARRRLDQLRRDVPAGRDRLELAMGTFARFRSLLLAEASRPEFFPGWYPVEQDPGMMLIEMWAYVCDVISMYEEQIGGECYVATADERRSLRRLIELLGYVPGPAVASRLTLAVGVEGHRPVTIPGGTAVESEELDDGEEQIFEVDDDTTVHPALNEFDVASATAASIDAAYGAGDEADTTETKKLHLDDGATSLRRDDELFVLLFDAGTLVHRRIEAHDEIRDVDGTRLIEVTFDDTIDVTEESPEQIRLFKSTRSIVGNMESNFTGLSDARVSFDAVYPEIRRGDQVIVEQDGVLKRAAVKEVHTEDYKKTTTLQEQADDDNGENGDDEDKEETTFHAWIEYTAITLDEPSLSSTGALNEGDSVVVHVRGVDGGRVQLPSSTHTDGAEEFAATAVGDVDNLAEQLQAESERDVAYEDARGEHALVNTTIEFDDDGQLVLTPNDEMPSMKLPLVARANLVDATRGETVHNEVLGSGDGSRANQRFELAEKPLTYLQRPSTRTGHGQTSTLRIDVDGVRWREVPNFFGAAPDDRVYIVREDEDGTSTVQFGDGRRGARLPTGRDNVVAHYRYGAGEPGPEPGQIDDWVDASEQVSDLSNPTAATGGGDAESRENIRTNAPRTALMLGRIVSLDDLEAATRSASGVRAALARWRFHSRRRRPVATVWHIGGGDELGEHLKSLADPTMSLEVIASKPRKAGIELSVLVDPDYDPEPVREELREELVGDSGLLRCETIGIDGVLFSSQLFEVVFAPEGVSSVQRIRIEREDEETVEFTGQDQPERRLVAGEGRHFEFELTSLTVKREES